MNRTRLSCPHMKETACNSYQQNQTVTSRFYVVARVAWCVVQFTNPCRCLTAGIDGCKLINSTHYMGVPSQPWQSTRLCGDKRGLGSLPLRPDRSSAKQIYIYIFIRDASRGSLLPWESNDIHPDASSSNWMKIHSANATSSGRSPIE